MGRNNGLQLWGPKSQGPKSQGRVHLPGPPSLTAASQGWGPQLTEQPWPRLRRDERVAGEGLPSFFQPLGVLGPGPAPQPFSFRPSCCWRPPPFRGASGGSGHVRLRLRMPHPAQWPVKCLIKGWAFPPNFRSSGWAEGRGGAALRGGVKGVSQGDLSSLAPGERRLPLCSRPLGLCPPPLPSSSSGRLLPPPPQSTSPSSRPEPPPFSLGSRTQSWGPRPALGD